MERLEKVVADNLVWIQSKLLRKGNKLVRRGTIDRMVEYYDSRIGDGCIGTYVKHSILTNLLNDLPIDSLVVGASEIRNALAGIKEPLVESVRMHELGLLSTNGNYKRWDNSPLGLNGT